MLPSDSAVRAGGRRAGSALRRGATRSDRPRRRAVPRPPPCPAGRAKPPPAGAAPARCAPARTAASKCNRRTAPFYFPPQKPAGMIAESAAPHKGRGGALPSPDAFGSLAGTPSPGTPHLSKTFFGYCPHGRTWANRPTCKVGARDKKSSTPRTRKTNLTGF